MELAVQGTAFGCYSNAGQICQSSERILVTPAVHDDVLSGLVRKAESIPLGHPLDDQTTMGPLNNEGVAQKVDEHIADAVMKGAVVVVGGERAEGFPTRLYYRPSVLDQVPPGSLIDDEETFGPVAPADHGPRRGRGHRRGELVPLRALLLRLHGQPQPRVPRRRAPGVRGSETLNETAAYWDGRTPFGGYSGKASGVGRLGGASTIESMTQLKSIVLDVGA